MDQEKSTPKGGPAEQAKVSGKVTFSKPYNFENTQYTEVDLSGVENMTAQDMVEAEKFLTRTGIISPIPEMTVEYICFIGHCATGLPVEFFKGLPARDAIKVKNKVTSFFYGEG